MSKQQLEVKLAPKVIPKRYSTRTILGMDLTSDPHVLPEGKVRFIQNLRPNESSLGTRDGLVKINSAELVASTPIKGLGRHHITGGSEYSLAVCNGGVYSLTDAGTSTLLHSGLSAVNVCQFVQAGDKSLLVDQSSGILLYEDSKTPYFAGLASPKVYRLIESFEALWIATNGTVALDSTFSIHGTYSLKVTNSSGALCTIYKTFTQISTLGTGVFSDGSGSNYEDYFSISVSRTDPSEISSCWLKLGDATMTNYWKARLDLTPEWLDAQLSYSTLDIKIRRRSFEIGAGAPTWGITRAQIEIQAVTGKAPVTRWDFLRLEKSGPRAFEYYKEIAIVDPTETWVAGGATIAWNWKYFVRGNNSLAITGNSSGDHVYLVKTLDLTTFNSGGASAEIDEIEIYLGKDTAAQTPQLTLRFYDDYAGGKYFTTTLTPVSCLALSRFAVSKADFTAVGSPSWGSIERIVLITSTNSSSTIYVDAVSMIKSKNQKVISLCEPVDVGVWAEVTTSGIVRTWTADTAWVKGSAGSTYAMHLSLGRDAVNGGTFIFSFTPTSALDLSKYSTNVTAQTLDKIGLYMITLDYRLIKSVTLKYGPVGMATNYYYYTFATEEIAKTVSPPLKQGKYGGHELSFIGEYPFAIWTPYWFDLRNIIANHTAVGSPNWNSIAEVRIEIVLSDQTGAAVVVFDQWGLERKGLLSGIYNYKMTYVSKNEEESDGSFASDDVEVRDNPIYITNLPTPIGVSASPNIVARNLYRIGGSSALWKLVARIDNLTTTAFVDEVLEDELGDLLAMEVEGAPLIPKCICLHKKKVIIGNLTGPDGTLYPSGVMVSNADSVEIFNHSLMFEIENHRGTAIKWLLSAFNRVYLGKEDSIWSFDPDNLTEEPTLETRLYAGVNPQSVIMGENEFYFLDPSGKVVSFNGSFFSSVGDDLYKQLRSYNFNQSNTHTHLQLFEDNLILAYTDFGTPANSFTYLCYKPQSENKLWWQITGWKMSVSISFKTSSVNKLYFGSGQYGYVYRGFSGTTDDGTIIPTKLRWGLDGFGVPEVRKDFAKLFFIMSKKSGTTTAFTITPIYDGDTDLTSPLTVGGTEIFKVFDIPTPPLDQSFRSHLGVEIATSTTFGWEFLWLVEIVRLLEEAY
jgi:hypothetical protein